jgi:hypothetical protein
MSLLQELHLCNWMTIKTLSSGLFPNKDYLMYNQCKKLVNQIHLPSNKALWKLKLPLKIKIFMWFLLKGVILTKDNLLKRHWRGDHRCCFCDNNETIQHMFFDCHVARFVWRIFTMTFGLRPPKDIAYYVECGSLK